MSYIGRDQKLKDNAADYQYNLGVAQSIQDQGFASLQDVLNFRQQEIAQSLGTSEWLNIKTDREKRTSQLIMIGVVGVLLIVVVSLILK